MIFLLEHMVDVADARIIGKNNTGIEYIEVELRR
jgi:hypothetical protein